MLNWATPFQGRNEPPVADAGPAAVLTPAGRPIDDETAEPPVPLERSKP